jgi:hypothetical protein
MKHRHYDLILLWADGAEMEYYDETMGWKDTSIPQWNTSKQYRVKPQNKVRQYEVNNSDKSTLFYANSAKPNLELTFSPEGKLINSRVL